MKAREENRCRRSCCRQGRRGCRCCPRAARQEIRLVGRCRAHGGRLAIGRVADLQRRHQRLRRHAQEGAGGGEAARLPAEPYSAHHADPQVEPGRDRRRRPLQSVLFGRAGAVHGQIPGVRPSGSAGACRQRSRPRRGHPQACQLPGRRDRQRSCDPFAKRGADAGQAEDPGDLLQHRREERMGHAGVLRQYRGGPLDRRAVRRQRGALVRLHFGPRRQPRQRRPLEWVSRSVCAN